VNQGPSDGVRLEDASLQQQLKQQVLDELFTSLHSAASSDVQRTTLAELRRTAQSLYFPDLQQNQGHLEGQVHNVHEQVDLSQEASYYGNSPPGTFSSAAIGNDSAKLSNQDNCLTGRFERCETSLESRHQGNYSDRDKIRQGTTAGRRGEGGTESPLASYHSTPSLLDVLVSLMVRRLHMSGAVEGVECLCSELKQVSEKDNWLPDGF
jgi:hypothetical protein